jgi:hypothetical protein
MTEEPAPAAINRPAAPFPIAVNTGRSSGNDALAPLAAMSDEEKIALFS